MLTERGIFLKCEFEFANEVIGFLVLKVLMFFLCGPGFLVALFSTWSVMVNIVIYNIDINQCDERRLN